MGSKENLCMWCGRFTLNKGLDNLPDCNRKQCIQRRNYAPGPDEPADAFDVAGGIKVLIGGQPYLLNVDADSPWVPLAGEPGEDEEKSLDQEERELIAWMGTEPGLMQRLAYREAQLARLTELGAPEIILENARRLVRETVIKLEKIGEPEEGGEI